MHFTDEETKPKGGVTKLQSQDWEIGLFESTFLLQSYLTSWKVNQENKEIRREMPEKTNKIILDFLELEGVFVIPKVKSPNGWKWKMERKQLEQLCLCS